MTELVKTQKEIEAMRHGGQMLAQVLDYLTGQVQPGITTKELAALAGTELRRLGGKPAFLGYQGFPAPICISVNDQVVHGIPGDYVVQEGDLVGLDLGVTYQGMITDGAVTVPVGKVTPAANRLLAATRQALAAGIQQVKAGVRVGDISQAIEQKLRPAGLGIIEDLSGHGVGRSVHEEPPIHNTGRSGEGPELLAGMTIAIEPMATTGGHRIKVLDDGWTIVTADGSLAAQFEHTVLVTPDGHQILTQA